LGAISQKHKIPPKNQNTRQTNYKALMLTTYQIRPSNYTNKIHRVPWGYHRRQSRHSLRAKPIPGNQLGY
jgi:hypothetical protein